jgi:hypothetical protein
VLLAGNTGAASAMMEWCAAGCPPPMHAGFQELPKPFDQAKGLHYENETALSHTVTYAADTIAGTDTTPVMEVVFKAEAVRTAP